MPNAADGFTGFRRSSIDGLECYAVYRAGVWLGWVRKRWEPPYRWGNRGVGDTSFIYDYDTRDEASRALGEPNDAEEKEA